MTDKHSVRTPEYEEIIKRYDGYSLNSESNIIELNGHSGRHTNVYHDYILEAIIALDAAANGFIDIFIKGMEEIGKIVKGNPGLPYAKKSDRIWRKENEGTEPG